MRIKTEAMTEFELYEKKMWAMQRDERYRTRLYQEVKKAGGLVEPDGDGYMTQIAPIKIKRI